MLLLSRVSRLIGLQVLSFAEYDLGFQISIKKGASTKGE